MKTAKEKIKQAVVRMRSKKSIIPKDVSISPRATIVKSYFEGLNAVGARCRIVHSQMGYGSYVSNDTELLTTKVGRYCSIGPHVLMPTGKHPVSEFATSSPLFYSPQGINGTSFVDENKFEECEYAEEKFSRVIGNDVWIGGGCIILEGVTIGDGAVIGAGALVTKNLPPYSVCFGVPARVIRLRYDEATVSRLLATKWWDRDEMWLREHVGLFTDTEALLCALEQGN